MTMTANLDGRVSVVYTLLLNGYRRRDIIDYLRTKTKWDVGASTVDKYIKEATAEIKEINALERDMAFGMATKRLDDLYKRALEDSDNKTALAVQKEINNLHGLSITRTEISGKDGGPIRIAKAEDLTDDELADIATGRRN